MADDEELLDDDEEEGELNWVAIIIAKPRPIPRPAPVTTATFPSSIFPSDISQYLTNIFKLGLTRPIQTLACNLSHADINDEVITYEVQSNIAIAAQEGQLP